MQRQQFQAFLYKKVAVLTSSSDCAWVLLNHWPFQGSLKLACVNTKDINWPLVQVYSNLRPAPQPEIKTDIKWNNYKREPAPRSEDRLPSPVVLIGISTSVSPSGAILTWSQLWFLRVWVQSTADVSTIMKHQCQCASQVHWPAQ